MRNKKNLLFLVLIFSVILLSGCSFFDRGNQLADQTDQAFKPNPELERQYEQALEAVLEPFWRARSSAGIRDQILELRTPGRYLDLHLNLVLAFDLIESGQAEADQSKIEQGIDRINQLKDQYPWLD